MKHILSAFGLALLAAAAAPADDVRSKPLTLHIVSPEQRALKHALLPELKDSIPGNAVDHYRQAIKNLKADAPSAKEYYPTLEAWLAAPLKDLPVEAVERYFKPFESTLREIEAGARCEQCDWGLTAKIRERGVATLLPDVQYMREIANIIALRVRFQLAEGKLDEAARTLQTGFAMSRDVADAPSLICGLVGMAVSSIMLDRLEEFIQQPGAPNLYWPLTDLPRPLFDLRKPMQGERLMAYGSFPGLLEMAADPNAKPWTPEQVEKAMGLLREFLQQDNRFLEIREEAEMLLRMADRHEAAKKVLIDEGRPKELVDAMPHIQVAVLAAIRQYDAAFDELDKYESLPFWEAQPAMDRAAERYKQLADAKDGPAIPMARLFLPGVKKVFGARTRMDRRVAALRCVEAVRLYAAAHDGKLPASLDDVTDVPVPMDPVTGKPFGYRLVGDRAFFSSAPFPGQPAINVTTPTYELSIH
ncbi:MAG TPA: hypothetical protein VMS17_22015 [Gemmataceae bacterium]|nr:hypothetical protein [Gemmataceae bacterium]